MGRSSNAMVAERFKPRDDVDNVAGELIGIELRFVIGARTEGGPLIPALLGVEAVHSFVLSLVVG